MSLESVNTSLVNSRTSRLKFGHFEPENLKYKTASDEQQVFSTICIIIIKNDSVKSIFSTSTTSILSGILWSSLLSKPLIYRLSTEQSLSRFLHLVLHNLRLIFSGIYWPFLLNNFDDNSLSYRSSAKQSPSRYIIFSWRRSVGWPLKESFFIFYLSKFFAPRLGQRETKLCSCCAAGVSFLCKK